jgi:hypothetical protein
MFSEEFNLPSLFASDTFATSMPGFNIVGFGADGDVRLGGTTAVPEASTWALILVGFAGLGVAGYRRSRWLT